MGDLNFDSTGRLIRPDNFVTENKAERTLRLENERREKAGIARTKAVNFGKPYTDKELLEVLEIDTMDIAGIEEIRKRLGRTPDGIRWILDHRDYYKTNGFMKKTEDSTFNQQIKRVIDNELKYIHQLIKRK